MLFPKQRLNVYSALTLAILLHFFLATAQFFDEIKVSVVRRDRAIGLLHVTSVSAENETEEMTIEEQRVETLKAGTFYRLHELRYLRLRRNGIKEIASWTFVDLPKLRILDVSFNSLKRINGNVFNGLPVSKLYLRGNGLEDINMSAFHHMPNLEVLDLSRNNLRELSGSLFLHDTGNLKDINLSFNKLTRIPKNLFRHAFANSARTDKTSVDLGHNQLSFLDSKSFRGVRYLKQLLLNDNEIEALGRDIFDDFESLEVLNLEGNALTSLSDNVLLALKHAEEIGLGANPWNCYFVRWYAVWCQRNDNRTNTIAEDVKLAKECNQD